MKAVGYAPLARQVEFLHGRPLLVTSQGGRVAVDARLLEIWRYAQGRGLPEVVAHFENLPAEGVRAALACLAEGGLLPRRDAAPPVRESPPERPTGDARLSVVIVTFNSRTWLEICLPSLFAQTHRPLEVIIVDNGSQDDTLPWLAAHYPHIRTLRMPAPGPLAAAINAGVRHAAGDYFLLLNPDVRLEPDAVAHLVAAAKAAPDAAAIAPKLHLLYAPGFLNGLGNHVGRFAFGVDNALGHLDLGQFDHWRDLPSACFAAALIPRQAWQAVGELDEGFPLYYEDSEWSYRARLMGWRIVAAPQAVVYHAYGGHAEAQPQAGLSA
ncbi:MAG: glycosyltransferase family 2 protein, partial [Anaerolineae bacterium]